MTEKNFNWNTFTHGIFINAPAEKLFEYVATSDGIVKWFMGSAFYKSKEGTSRTRNDPARSGDEYYWKWLNKDLELKGNITQSESSNLFQFTFSPLYLVTISINNEPPGKSKLILKQEYQRGASKNEFNFLNCCTCWVFFLTNLKSVVENGIDLREEKAVDEILCKQMML